MCAHCEPNNLGYVEPIRDDRRAYIEVEDGGLLISVRYAPEYGMGKLPASCWAAIAFCPMCGRNIKGVAAGAA